MTIETKHTNKTNGVVRGMVACGAALFACFALLFALAPNALAVDRVARVEVFQIVDNAGWSGLTESYRYCLEADDPNAPMPVVDGNADDGESLQGNVYYFTMNGSDGSEDNPHEIRIPMTGNEAERSYVYHLYLSIDPEPGYDYRRYFFNNAESGTHNYAAGADAVREATEYIVVVYPNIYGEQPLVTYQNSKGEKIAGAGWQNSFVRQNGTVTFVRNVKGSNSTHTQTWAIGATAQLDKNTFTRSGYQFAGWNTRANGSGTSYSDGQAYKMTPTDLVLYAQWERSIDPDVPRIATIPVYPKPSDGDDDGDDDNDDAATPETTTPPTTTTNATPTVTMLSATPAATPTATATADDDSNAVVAPQGDDRVPESIEEPPSEAIDDNGNPLAGSERVRYWSLINLLFALGGTAAAVVLVVSFVRHRKEADAEISEARNQEELEEAKRRKRMLRVGLVSVAPAVASIVAFALTQDVSSQMVWVDMWTILFAALLAVNVAVLVLCKKKSKNKNDNDPSQEQGGVELVGAYN